MSSSSVQDGQVDQWWTNEWMDGWVDRWVVGWVGG